VLSVAEFNAPLVPGIRSVEYPSMNKDGVPFGVMAGILAIRASQCGFEGNKNLLESDEHKHYLDDLGKKWQVLDLYFKPYTCCRWAHPAIDACVGLMQEHGLKAEDIQSATIHTFHRATLLSKIVPQTADEAQYNIAYPVAAALVYGDFGLAQVREESLGDPAVVEMMGKLSFVTDPELDKQFPAHRICVAEIVTRDGRTLVSPQCEPRGEAYENIRFEWLADKFKRITGPVLTQEGQQHVLESLSGDLQMPVREWMEKLNTAAWWKC
jgi:2-methylcitrate dehydratase PrpD